MTAYYNENDPATVFWLRELIGAGMVAPGIVDDRSIEDVLPSDLKGFTQCHFFAGVGGWSYALRLAGWDDDRPVWTGSCPCQPFSQAGKGKGFADERHLWPAWHWLIAQCHPGQIFGEQVGRIGGMQWIDLVFDDLEAVSYTCGAADLPACSAGAPHIRQRLFWVANAAGNDQRRPRLCRESRPIETGGCSTSGRMANAHGQGLSVRPQPDVSVGSVRTERATPGASGLVRNPWADCEWIRCTDGTVRPTGPGLLPLAHGVPGRVELLRGYGNAIVPQVAAEFVQAAMTL